jgi:hypothetical protein
VKHAVSIAVSFALFFAAAAAHATPIASGAPVVPIYEAAGRPPLTPIDDVTVAQALSQLTEIAAWDVSMQYTGCTDVDGGADAAVDGGADAEAGAAPCEFGGVIEVETGPGHAIVASDNTQEAIFNWSYNQKLTGDTSHLPAAANAFEYLSVYPGYLAWQVAGDPGPDYYSVYNCGWGVRAVVEYEAVTGDTSHHAYGQTCADHIAANAMGLVSLDADLLTVAPAAWAASGLWLWGDANSDATYKTTAATIGGAVKAWIEQNGVLFLPEREWAVTGGATFYGVVESYMKENPSELVPWVTQYAPMLGGWIDESMAVTPNDWTDWRNAHAGWNMLAQFTAAHVLGPGAGDANEQIADDILTKLVAQAMVGTGGIPGSQQRPPTEAETWITAYLVSFGLQEIIAESDQGDAGAPEAGTPDAAVDFDAEAPSADEDGGTNGATSSGKSSSSCGCLTAGATSANGASLGALFGIGIVAAAWRRESARRRRVSR